MTKYLFTCSYSPGSWARLVKAGHDDRITMAREFAAALGGNLDGLWWNAHGNAAIVLCDLPDDIVAKAIVTATYKTGAFTSVDAVELLTQEQLGDVLALTLTAGEFFEAPGTAVFDGYEADGYSPDGHREPV